MELSDYIVLVIHGLDDCYLKISFHYSGCLAELHAVMHLLEMLAVVDQDILLVVRWHL